MTVEAPLPAQEAASVTSEESAVALLPEMPKKRRISYVAKLALMEAVAGRSIGLEKSLRDIARGHGISHGVLRNNVSDYYRGRIELGEIESDAQMLVAEQVSDADVARIVARVGSFVTQMLNGECMMAEVESKFTRRRGSALDRVERVMDLTLKLTRLKKAVSEHGKELRETLRKEREKEDQQRMLNAKAINVPSVTVIRENMSREEKMREALRGPQVEAEQPEPASEA